MSPFLPAQCTTQKNIPTTERKWKIVPACSSYKGRSLSNPISKLVTRCVRHYDQEELQSDTAVHWDTIRPKLLRGFADRGARDFSEKDWLRHSHEGSNKTRFAYCEDSKNSLTYFRVIQGHTGGITIAPELMGHVIIPYDWKEFVFHMGCSFSIKSILENRLIAGGKQSEDGRQTIFFTHLNPFAENPDEEAPSTHSIPENGLISGWT